VSWWRKFLCLEEIGDGLVGQMSDTASGIILQSSGVGEWDDDVQMSKAEDIRCLTISPVHGVGVRCKMVSC